jgi:hypothetical protein
MATLSRTKRLALTRVDNPILWQERVHQEARAPRWSRYGLIAGLLVGALLVALTVWLLITGDGYTAMQLALFVVWGVQAVTMMRAIIAGANVISREHVGQTWDALVLTGVSARQIVLGKWRAALYAIRGWLLTLGVVRIAMLPVFCLGILKIFAIVSFGRYSTTPSYRSYYWDIEWVPWAWILAVVLSVGITLLEVLCCTALGMAASALTRRPIPAAVGAIAVRFFPVITFAAFMRYQLGVTYFWRWWGETPFALSDSGTSAMMVLALPNMPWTRGDHERTLPGLALACAMLCLMLVFALVLTRFAIRRDGALRRHRASMPEVEPTLAS